MYQNFITGSVKAMEILEFLFQLEKCKLLANIKISWLCVNFIQHHILHKQWPVAK